MNWCKENLHLLNYFEAYFQRHVQYKLNNLVHVLSIYIKLKLLGAIHSYPATHMIIEQE